MAEKLTKPIDLIARTGSPTDEGYIDNQVDYLKRRCHLDFSAKKAELADLNTEMQAAVNSFSFGGDRSKLTELLNRDEPLKVDHERDKKRAIELQAAVIANPIPYIATGMVTTYDKLLQTGKTLSLESYKQGELMQYQYAQEGKVALEVAAGGGLNTRQIRNGKTRVHPILIDSSAYVFDYDTLSSNLGAVAIEIRSLIRQELGLFKENYFQVALKAAIPDASTTQDDELSKGAAHATHRSTPQLKLVPSDLITLQGFLNHIGTTSPSATAKVKPTHQYPVGAYMLTKRGFEDLAKAGTEYWSEEFSQEMVIDAIVGIWKLGKVPVYMNPITDDEIQYCVTTPGNLGVYIPFSIGGRSGVIEVDEGISSVPPFKTAKIHAYEAFTMYIAPYGISMATITGRV